MLVISQATTSTTLDSGVPEKFVLQMQNSQTTIIDLQMGNEYL